MPIPLLDMSIKTRTSPSLKRIQYSELVAVLHEICDLSSIERSEKGSKYDLELSLPFLEAQSLQDHVYFPRRDFKRLPLNSERHVYEMNNVVIRNLHIRLDNRDGLTTHADWHPLDSVKWHFEKCHFEPTSPNMWTLDFPWRGSFRFYKNEFPFDSAWIEGHWLFVFGLGSRVLFHRNDFGGNSIQTVGSPRKTGQKTADRDGPPAMKGKLSFAGNRGITALGIQEGYSAAAFTGMNRVDSLSFFEIQESGQVSDLKIHIGPREKIDPNFHHCMHHRQLFVDLKRIAAANQDTHQTSILDRHLERIDYFLNKAQDSPHVKDYGAWIEYWQDRILYGWRRWSSDFYRSWLRPLIVILVSYIVLNAVPALFLDGYSFSQWIEFSLRPVGNLYEYAGTLNEMWPSEYRMLSIGSKNVLKLIGLFEVIWLAMWGFALAKAIRK